MLRIILTIGTIQGLVVLVQLIKSKITAVYLGPAAVGIMGILDQFVQTFAFIVSLGINESATKFLSRAHSQSPHKFSSSFYGLLKPLFFLSITGVAALIGLILWQPNIFGQEIEKYQFYLILALITVPAYVLGLYFTRVLAAAQNYNASSLLSLISNTVATVAVATGAVVAGLTGVYLGSILSGVFLTLGTAVFLHKRLNFNFSERNKETRSETHRSSETVSFAAILYFVSITNSISYLAARYIVLKHFGEVEAGYLHTVFTLSLVIGLILNPGIKLYFAPIINRDLPKLLKIKLAVEFQRRMIILLLLAALPIVLFPQLNLTILFSSKFAVASHVVFLFVVAQFIFQAAYMNLTLLLGVDDLKGYGAAYILGQLIFALLCLFLVPHFGLSGVAYGLIISSSILLIQTFIRLLQNHGYSASLSFYFLLAYTLLILYMIGLISSQSEEYNLLISFYKLAALLPVLSVIYFFLNEEEKRTLKKYFLRNIKTKKRIST